MYGLGPISPTSVKAISN